MLYEEDDFLAVNKPAGLLVHHTKQCQVPGVRCEDRTLVDWLLENRPEVKNVGDDPITRPGIVHRLDRETSGVMLVAKTQEAFLRLKSLFASRGIQKTYLAVARGTVREERGVIERSIGIVSGSTKRSVHSQKMVKEAVTEYAVRRAVTLPDGSAGTLLAVSPKTGRTHQIRVHLASIGHPIIGDSLYGKSHRAKSKGRDGKQWMTNSQPQRLMLHAYRLEFSSGPGKRLVIEAPPPAEFTPYLSTRPES